METKKSDSKRLANVDILILPIFYSYLTPFNERRTYVSDFLREAFRKCLLLERRIWKKRRQNLGAFLVSLFILLLQAKRASFRQSIPGYFAYYFLDNYCMILSPQRSVQTLPSCFFYYDIRVTQRI